MEYAVKMIVDDAAMARKGAIGNQRLYLGMLGAAHNRHRRAHGICQHS
ncbi:MAG: hypothetical protein NVSMB27_38480 [Ktedonobacteraceae bacterium]